MRLLALALLVLPALGCGEAPPPVVELWFAGDVHLGGGGADVLRPLGAAMAPALGVVNLEGPIDPRAPASGTLRGPGALRLLNGPATPPALAAAGVVAAGLANNHALDAGPEGQDLTIRSLQTAGVLAFGGPAGVATLERAGLRVALAGFEVERAGPDAIAAGLTRWRDAGEVLVVSLHTSGAPLYLPEPPLRAAADAALAAGASVVVAHGSHSLAGAERRGAAVVAWGLGNAAFACDCTDEVEGLALRVRLGAGGVEAAALVPIDAGLGGAPARGAADPDAVLDLLTAIGVAGRRGADRLELTRE